VGSRACGACRGVRWQRWTDIDQAGDGDAADPEAGLADRPARSSTGTTESSTAASVRPPRRDFERTTAALDDVLMFRVATSASRDGWLADDAACSYGQPHTSTDYPPAVRMTPTSARIRPRGVGATRSPRGLAARAQKSLWPRPGSSSRRTQRIS